MLSIVIPTLSLKRKKNKRYFYKDVYSIENALKSLAVLNIPIEIIVICNGNDQDLIDFVKKSKEITRYCIQSENLGVARSWNVGFHMSQYDYVLFMNDDVILKDDSALNEMLNLLNTNPEIGNIGPQGSFWKNFEHEKFYTENVPGKADVVSGFFFITKKSVFKKIGGFDNNYTPAGCEEIDYCFNVTKNKYLNYIYPTDSILHSTVHGISARDTDIKYLDKTINTKVLDLKNKEYLKNKWSKKFGS